MAASSINKFKLTGPQNEESHSVCAATLSCHLSPELSAAGMEIRWFKETHCVCVYKNGQVIEGSGRVSLIIHELEKGNVSLQIRNFEQSDTGDYLCQVTDGNTTEECTLGVSGPFSNLLEDVSSEGEKGQNVLISQENRKWTEEEKFKMNHSALLTELFGQKKDSQIQDQDRLLTEVCLLMKKKELEEKKVQHELRQSTEKLEENQKGNERLESVIKELQEKSTQLETRIKLLRDKEDLLEKAEKEKESSKKQLETLGKKLQEKERILTENIKTVEVKDRELEEKKKLLTETTNEFKQRTKKLEEELKVQKQEMEKSLLNKNEELNDIKQQLKDKEIKLKENEVIIKENVDSINARDLTLRNTNEKLESVTKGLQETNTQRKKSIKLLKEKESVLEETEKEVERSKKQLETLEEKLREKSRELQEMMILLEQQKTELRGKDKQLEEKKRIQLQEGTDLDPSAPVRRRNSMKFIPPTMSGELCSAASLVSVPAVELRLVLLGRTGCGKIAAGNSILGREERSQAGASTVRQQSKKRQREVAGRRVTVVDTPDWFCPGLSLEELRQDVEHCVHLAAPGPHAFLLVLPLKQSTGEERGMLEKMEEMFGERCWRNTMILFTVTDEIQEKNIEEFVQSENQVVQRLVENCGNRFHSLNINERGDGSRISELLEKIEKMVEENREKFYSIEIYLETQSQIRDMEIKIMRAIEEKGLMEEREKLENEMKKFLGKIEGAVQKHEGEIKQLDDRTTELERRVKEERDEQKKKELKRDLERELERRTEMEEKVKRLKEKSERERSEMAERHRQEMEEIRETYEGEARKDVRRHLMKIILPELKRNILLSKSKMQEEFSRQLEEKDGELQKLKLKLSQLTETHTVLEEVYESTVKSSSVLKRDPPAAEGRYKGISQTFRNLFQ